MMKRVALSAGRCGSECVEYSANGYRNWERFRNRCMLVLEKGIDFEIDKDDGSIKMVEKKEPDNKCCPIPITAINRFGVYTAL